MQNNLNFWAQKAIVASTCMLVFACGDEKTGVSTSNNQNDAGWDIGDNQDGGADVALTPDVGESDAGADAQEDASADTSLDLCLNVDCSAMDDACNQGVCDPATGACETQPAQDGTSCDDGDLCSTTDVCTAGVCAGAVVDCSGADDQCNVGACDVLTGACVPMPVVDDTSCDDGDLCSGTDVCVAGVCTGSAIDCSGSADQCNDASCNPNDGLCVITPKADGVTCDDADLCTLTDVCVVGVCSGTVLDCSGVTDQCNGGLCTAGTCAQDPVTDGSSCDAENLCSWSDSCQMGACAAGTVGDCSVTDIVVTNGASTPAQGGTGGGAFVDTCPLGQVVIGVEGLVSGGFYDRIIYQFATRCGEISVANGVVTTTPAVRLPATGGRGGGPGGAPVVTMCPANQAMVGFSGSTAGAFVSQVTLSCAPLTVTGTTSTGFAVAVGAANNASTLGTRFSTAMPASVCPAGMMARGTYGKSGDVLDNLGMNCGAIQLAVATTAPIVGVAGGGTSIDSCPAGQVPVSLTAAVSTAFYSGILTEYSMQCGTLDITPAGTGWTTTISAGARVPTTGFYGNWTFKGAPSTVSCPANQAIVGLTGMGNQNGAKRLTPSCAPVIVTGDTDAGFVVSYGAPTDTATLGTSVAVMSGPYYCPEGTLGSGFIVNAGQILDGLSLRCAHPTIRP